MAGDWIKMEHVTADKPEIYGIAASLGVTPEDALGRCFRVWVWADQQSLNGHAICVTTVTLDSVARRDGFAAALLKCGWLTLNDDGTVSFPNFGRHNGETAKNRALSGKRKKEQRQRDKEQASNSHANVTEVSRNNRDNSVTREEKRREEIESLPPTEVGKTGKPVCPPCPIDEIISLYHEVCPVNPRFLVRNESRDGYIRARWKQFFTEGDFSTKEGGIECFRWFFENQVRQSKFLTGQSNGRNGEKPFIADLEWLMRPSNFAKVIEGKYA